MDDQSVPQAETSRLSGVFRHRVTIALVAAGALLPVVVSYPTTESAAAAAVNYVAMGDSYTSGPDIPTQYGSPAGCLRSMKNYPADTTNALGLTLDDVSCSGATTANITTTGESVTGGTNIVQIDAVTKLINVVSLQVGGDDLGFTSILENCIALTPWGPTKVGANCKSYYDPNGKDSLAAAIQVLQPKIVSILEAVQSDAASNAKVFVVGYPDILPQTGACWPSMPFETSDAQYLNQTEKNLNTALDNAVAAANAASTTGTFAYYVDTYTPSENYNACTSSSTRWVEPIVPKNPAYPVHPNATGEAGMAGLLEAAMKAEKI
ncbi:MAG TPA: SGNH/GDSL hydrolase family protein [Acidimicrobiales bacterium]|nr:SGNH/GDSL hydrolase family protein [Acidimicrobiales bacterium]